eukprot:SAG31_NODE_510_length_14725_cov_2.829482_2_plen_63_part_00
MLGGLASSSSVLSPCHCRCAFRAVASESIQTYLEGLINTDMYTLQLILDSDPHKSDSRAHDA